MDDELSEFDFIDVDEIHLVGMPANGVPTPLLAKAAAPATDQTKGRKKMSKSQKKLVKALGVDLAGRSGSTAADRQKDTDLRELLREAGSQTRLNSQSGGRAYKAIVKALDHSVTQAQASVAAAQNVFEASRATEELRNAQIRRYRVKAFASEVSGANKGPFPHSAALFGKGAACSTYTLPSDEVGRGNTRYV